MSEMTVDAVPEGFVPLAEGLGFIDNLQPIYRRIQGKEASIGLLVSAQHGNTMGVCHGGVLLTLADIAAASGVNLAKGLRGGAPTVNLAVDFIAAARIGQWIQADVQQAVARRRFGFCSGTIFNSLGIVARFNGTFYFPDHQGLIKGQAVGDGVPSLLSD